MHHFVGQVIVLVLWTACSVEKPVKFERIVAFVKQQIPLVQLLKEWSIL